MKWIKVILTLSLGFALGILGMVYADTGTGTGDSGFKKSPLSGGGWQVPHNQRLHLSTDHKWISEEGHLSDLIRLQWTEDRAKPAISWADEKGKDKTAIVSHAKANDPKQHDHNHLSIETTMDPKGKHANELFTRFEVPFDQDIAEIRTHSSNFNVLDGIMRIAGTEGVDRDLQLAKSNAENEVTPRWTIRADHTKETGSNEGSNFNIIRYTDEGEAMDTPFSIHRSSGYVGIGNSDPQTKLDVDGDSIRIRKSKTPASASAPGQVGEIAWDNEYYYICVAPNKWKRSALTDW